MTRHRPVTEPGRFSTGDRGRDACRHRPVIRYIRTPPMQGVQDRTHLSSPYLSRVFIRGSTI